MRNPNLWVLIAGLTLIVSSSLLVVAAAILVTSK